MILRFKVEKARFLSLKYLFVIVIFSFHTVAPSVMFLKSVCACVIEGVCE